MKWPGEISMKNLFRYLWKFCWNNLRLYFGDNTVNSSSYGCFSVSLHLSKFLTNFKTSQFYKFHKLLLNLPEIQIKNIFQLKFYSQIDFKLLHRKVLLDDLLQTNHLQSVATSCVAISCFAISCVASIFKCQRLVSV